ncbi:ATP-binding cassette domain-containing protein, partial [Mycobacterium tuberculosis]|nr:ATP-binding cassette domain-containing protein [Mycobacterium tuberculosis]
MAYLELDGLGKAFGATAVVRDFNLAVERGEFISFLGPSGCGKTTVLRMIAGFETPSSGAIRVEGQDISPLPANRRNIGMVFQAYA